MPGFQQVQNRRRSEAKLTAPGPTELISGAMGLTTDEEGPTQVLCRPKEDRSDDELVLEASSEGVPSADCSGLRGDNCKCDAEVIEGEAAPGPRWQRMLSTAAGVFSWRSVAYQWGANLRGLACKNLGGGND